MAEHLVVQLTWLQGRRWHTAIAGPWLVTPGNAQLGHVAAFMRRWLYLNQPERTTAVLSIATDPDLLIDSIQGGPP